MKRYAKVLLKTVLLLHFFVLLLFLSCFIPKQSIVCHIQDSMSQFSRDLIRPYVIPDVKQSIADHVADARILNLILHMDESHPVRSIFLSEYYQIDNIKSVDTLQLSLDGVEHDVVPYSRYWHGFRLLYRVLLVFFDMNQIKWFLGLIAILLLFLIGKSCYHKKQMSFFLYFLISLCITSYWFGFVALEYIPVILIMLLGVLFVLYQKYDVLFLFAALGVSTAFFDFFTIETITFTVPFLMYAYLYKSNIRLKTFLECGCFWCFGYAFTFLYKWLLTKLLYGNIVDSAVESISKYQNGFLSFYGIPLNIKLLFWFDIPDNNVYSMFFSILVVLFVIFYFIRKENINWHYVIMLCFICIIPYVRYKLLINHAYVHYFFTYRAQICLILSILMLLHENYIKEKWLQKKFK